jgi:DNA polymerase-3 subunit epsilon
LYAIVDIETTGGFAGNNSITEIAVFIHDGQEVVHQYASLINPGRPIPHYITGLTGITNDMVQEAPAFSEVASTLYELLHDKVFIAHNVQFDYSFVKHALEQEGFTFRPKKLCTVRLSRKVYPGMRSYSLGNLCESLRIPITDRHRASGDARATAVLFDRILKSDAQIVTEMLAHRSRENILPPNLPREEFEQLPESPGVYYFLDAHGHVIYVGKAINIKKRILGHFGGTAKGTRNQYMRNEVHHITYELTGNELVALVLESQEIRRLWPKYNQAQKRPASNWGIYSYEDREGLVRLQIGKQARGLMPLALFHNHSEAWQFLLGMVKENELCPKLAGIQKSAGACYDHALGKCAGACVMEEPAEVYNSRVYAMLDSWKSQDGSYIIVGDGRDEEECSVILVEEGTYSGFGFYDRSLSFQHPDEVREVIRPSTPTAEIDQYLQSHRYFDGMEIIPL